MNKGYVFAALFCALLLAQLSGNADAQSGTQAAIVEEFHTADMANDGDLTGTVTADATLNARYTHFSLLLEVTQSAATALDVDASCGVYIDDGGATRTLTYFSITARDIAVSSGVATATLGTLDDDIAISASANLRYEYGVSGCDVFRATITATGADTDTIDVSGRAVFGG